MTDTTLSLTGLTAIAHSVGVTDAQARALMEYAGVKVQPEMPALPTEPGDVIIATKVRGVRGKWRAFLAPYGLWVTSERVGDHVGHRPDHITASIPARIVPVAAAPVTLTEEQVGEFHEVARLKNPAGAGVIPFRRLSEAVRAIHTATANAILAQYAAPAEGEPIDVDDVREGDRVRVVLNNGDEATITVTRVAPDFLTSERYVFYACNIRAIHLLDREGEG